MSSYLTLTEFSLNISASDESMSMHGRYLIVLLRWAESTVLKSFVDVKYVKLLASSSC